jgi:hypothetical protein
MNKKFITIAEFRELDAQYFLGEISYSKIVEVLNEKAENWYKDRLCEDVDKLNELLANAINKAKDGRHQDFAKGGVINKVSDNFSISKNELILPAPKKGMHPYDNDQYMFQGD